MNDLWEKMRGEEVFLAYARALSVADKAAPIDIPKADGMLQYAELQLREAMVAQGITPEHCDAMVLTFKAQIREGK